MPEGGVVPLIFHVCDLWLVNVVAHLENCVDT